MRDVKVRARELTIPTMRRFSWHLFLSAASIGVFALGYVYFRPVSLEMHAARIVALCASAENHTECYEHEVPKLIDAKVSFEDAFEVAYIIQRLDSTGEYCHRIGHELGSKETAKDPAKWKEVARRTPLGRCLAGGLHGAFQEHFRRVSLPPGDFPVFIADMKGFCDVREDLPSSPVDLSMCAHGLGHLFLFATNGDVYQSARACAAVSFSEGGGVTAEGQELSCLDGMFMQLFEPHEPEDYALIAKNGQTKDTVGAFCNTFNLLPRAACIARSAPMFYKDLSLGAPKPLDCETLVSEQRRDSCFSTQMRLFARDTYFNLDATDDYCVQYKAEKRGLCYASAGSFAFMAGYDYEQPFRFCARAQELGVGDECYETLAQFIPFVFSNNAETRATFCERLPHTQKARCESVRPVASTSVPAAR